MEELRAGNKSEPRNPIIARVMYARKALEAWGRGIKLIIEECARARLPEPQIVSEGGYTKTVFMRPNGGIGATQKATTRAGLKTGLKTGLKSSLKRRDAIIEWLRSQPSITIEELMSKTGLSRNGIKWNLSQLKAAGRIRRVGPAHGGHWEIVSE